MIQIIWTKVPSFGPMTTQLNTHWWRPWDAVGSSERASSPWRPYQLSETLAVLAYVAGADVQPAPDNGVDRHGAEGWPSTWICARQQGVLSHVIGGQHLHLMKGLHCRFTLTQHVLGTQNSFFGEKKMRCHYLQACIKHKCTNQDKITKPFICG